jgi:CRP-like cAMP-binding protein
MDNSSSLPSELVPFHGNQLLAALPVHTLQHLAPHLKPILLHTGTTLFETGSESDAVYFPKSGIVSMVLTSASGVAVEVGLAGPEGALGLLDALSSNPNSVRAQVQIAGNGWRLPAATLREEFEFSAPFRGVVLKYQHAMSTLTAQNVLCNRLHSVEQRLAKWLLLVQDRVKSEELELTHEFIATMLGSRREAVTLAASSLREVGLISYRRGFVTILDRVGLEHLACECYPVLRDQFKI